MPKAERQWYQAVWVFFQRSDQRCHRAFLELYRDSNLNFADKLPACESQLTIGRFFIKAGRQPRRRKIWTRSSTKDFWGRLPKSRPAVWRTTYRALAEFNNVVLAGHQTKFGMEFVTWEWVQNHTALWQGHYYGDNYTAAKQDFVTRSGLIPSCALFSPEQLTEVYRSIYETLENYSITSERQQYLQSAADQMEAFVPDLEARAEVSLQKEEAYCDALDPEEGGYETNSTQIQCQTDFLRIYKDLRKKADKPVGEHDDYKTDPDLFELLGGIEGVKIACERAKKRIPKLPRYTGKSFKCSKYCPGTNFYFLIEELQDLAKP